MARKRLGEILIEAGVIDETKLRVALREQQRWGGQLGRQLIELRLVHEEDLVRALATQLNIPIAPELLMWDIAPDTLDLLTLEFCQAHAVIPFFQEGKFLDLALCDPTNLSTLDDVRIRTKLNVRPYIVGPRQIERAIDKHYKGVDPNLPRARSGSSAAAGGDNIPGLRYVDFTPPPTPAPAPTPMASPASVAAPAAPVPTPAPATAAMPVARAAFEQLQRRVVELEALVARDEAVLRKLLGLLVEARLVTREQLLACLQD
ncbi:MAG TPA: hypothetical protein VKN99_15720 [Polyangia bacterium]|nr:hypothetical protein [Polyangia bacterium]